jgi:hypothetical protein
MIRTVTATRYVTPFREGGSVPVLVEADDDGMYVLKLRGAGQGPKVLVAELIAGVLGRALELPVPEIVLVHLVEALVRAEPDPELQGPLKASVGLNLGLDFLPGSITFDPLPPPRPDPTLAAAIVWFDAYLTNVDRTARNPNLLLWHKRLWMIDHGAALYFHHIWAGGAAGVLGRAGTPFAVIKNHVLLPFTSADAIMEADARLRPQITPALLEEIVGLLPDAWLEDVPGVGGPAEQRAAYVAYLLARLDPGSAPVPSFVEEARNARAQRL